MLCELAGEHRTLEDNALHNKPRSFIYTRTPSPEHLSVGFTQCFLKIYRLKSLLSILLVAPAEKRGECFARHYRVPHAKRHFTTNTYI